MGLRDESDQEQEYFSETQFHEEEPEGDDLYADNILAEDDASEERDQSDYSDMEDMNARDDQSNISVGNYFKQALKHRLHEEKELMKRFKIRDTASLSSDSQYSQQDLRETIRRNPEEEKRAPATAQTHSTPKGLLFDSAGSFHIPTDERLPAEDANILTVDSIESSIDSFDWTNNLCSLSEWVHEKRVRASFISAIKAILWSYQTENTYIYRQKIRQAVRENKQSLEVHFLHLCMYKDAVIGRWLADIPSEIIPMLDEAASEVMGVMFPRYSAKQPDMYVRITGLSIKDSIRNLRSVQLRSLINIDGVIIRRSPVFKQLLSLSFDCNQCGERIGPLLQNGPKEVKPIACPRCQFKGPFKLNILHSQYRSHQIMVLQESPGSVPPGRLPRTIELHLTNDLVDSAKPGDNVDVVGVFCNSYDPVLHDKQGFPVFMTTLEVNNMVQQHVEGQKEILDDDFRRIRELAKHPLIKEKLLRSVAPAMHGHEDVKLGLLLSLLGGVTKHHTGHRIRGDINVLLLGDPGMGKSQFLKWVERSSQRAVFTTGKGSSAVGLTAAVRKDAVSGEYVLEGGAMVIADRGVCLIDEFDKMSDVDRTSIHEAMEQQTISIARAGIVTTLSAQCTVIAAANPISGSYDRTVSLAENVHLTRPILSRFDLIHIITDEPSADSDYILGKFVTRSHRQSHPEVTKSSQSQHFGKDSSVDGDNDTIHEKLRSLPSCAEEPSPLHAREDSDPSSSLPLYLSLFKKYIQYARSHCMPKILQVDPGRLPNLFAELRQVTPVTVRELESIIRLAEAHARIRLREFVQEEDFSEAIALFLRCYLKRHRLGEQRQLKAKFRKYLAIDDKRWIPLIETRLEEIIHTELALNKTDSEGQIRIAFETISGIVEKDGIPHTTLHKILSTQDLLGGKVRFEGNVLIFK